MSPETTRRCDFDTDKLLLRLRLTVAATVEGISPVVDQVMDMVKQMGCAQGHEFAIELALQEALANAVVHGARKDPGKQVDLSVACDMERGMLIVVSDPGTGFDPACVPCPVTGQQIYSEHGRGIYLINQLMDEVRFEKGGTEIHMRKFA